MDQIKDQNSNDILPYENYVINRYSIDDQGIWELVEVYGVIMGESIPYYLNRITALHPVTTFTIWKLTNL